MAIRVVRLGSPRCADEGIRIGIVRYPPRGVRKSQYASRNWYDVWFPVLAPAAETVKLGRQAKTPRQFERFMKKYKSEMSTDEASQAIRLLAALSKRGDFSVGCYCENENRCHRSVLRKLLLEQGAKIK